MMASRSLLRCVQRGLATRTVVPTTATTVTSFSSAGRCFSTSQSNANEIPRHYRRTPLQGRFDFDRQLRYLWHYFQALNKDVWDCDLDLGMSEEKTAEMQAELDALQKRIDDGLLLKGPEIPDHTIVFERLAIFRKYDNWKDGEHVYKFCLCEQQLYDYMDPEWLQDFEDWLMKTHPRWKLYNIEY